ncbi:MAG: Multidrug resistance protein MdtG [Methanonatronarchaeales archaeon]|nr:Multidrug resistance protein MdtG [Methanonatronarchaeales archaeon]
MTDGVLDRFGIDRDVFVLGLARMTDSLGNSLLIVVLPLYVGDVGEGFAGLSDPLLIGVVLSTFGLVNALAQPFAGRMTDVYGRRKPFIVLGLGTLAATTFAYSLLSYYPGMVAVRALQGLGVALTIPATMALLSEVTDAGTRGGAMGFFNTMRMVGFGTGPIVAGLVEVAYGFDAAFYVGTAGAVVSLVLVQLLVREERKSRQERREARERGFGHLRVLRDGELDEFFVLGLTSFFMATGIALMATLEPQFNARLDQTSLGFGAAFSAFIVSQVLFQTPIGRWSDLYGRKPFILVGLLFLAPTTVAQGFVATTGQLIGARFLQGVAGAMVFAPAFALAGDKAHRASMGGQMSLLTMGFGLGTAAGPLLSGFLVNYGFRVPFLFGGAVALFSAALVWFEVEESAR